MLKAAIVMLSIFVVATGVVCGSNDEQATPVSDEAFLVAAEAAASTTHLTLNDFPAGWVGTPYETDESTPAEDEAFFAAMTPECREIAESFGDRDVDYPSALLTQDSDVFNPDDGSDLDVDTSSGVAVFRARETAKEDWDRSNAFLDQCLSEIPTGLRASFAVNPQPGVEITRLDMVEVDAPDLGDGATRIQIDMELANGDRVFHITSTQTSILSGRLIGSTEWSDWGEFDQALGESLAALVAERLAAADESLPE